MKTGKISESILKRSVLRQIQTHRDEVLKGAGVGEDCGCLSWKPELKEKQRILAFSTETVALPVKEASYLAVMAAANNLAASGACPVAVSLALTLPAQAEESLLKELMRHAQTCCKELDIQIAGGHTEVSNGVGTPVVTATVLGNGIPEGAYGSRPENLEIVVSKWAGMEGTFLIAGEREEELLKRYPSELILKAREQGKFLSVAPEAARAIKSGVYAMHDVRCGGIFGALWEISQKLGTGLCADIKKIPIKQETIEVCEFYNLNPYEILSGGMLLMVTREGGKLVRTLAEKGIPAAVIGNMNDSNDKIVVNRDDVRYLGPPLSYEIHKLFL